MLQSFTNAWRREDLCSRVSVRSRHSCPTRASENPDADSDFDAKSSENDEMEED